MSSNTSFPSPSTRCCNRYACPPVPPAAPKTSVPKTPAPKTATHKTATAPKKETATVNRSSGLHPSDPLIKALFEVFEEYEADDESDSSSSSSTTSSESSYDVRSSLKIFFDHDHGEYYDLMTISPVAFLDDDDEEDEEDEEHEEPDFCQFSVKYYYDRTATEYKLCNEMILSAEEVYDYINRTLKMVAVDEEPYAKVSFDIPMFPSVSYSPKRLCKKVVRKLVLGATSDYLGDCLNGEYPIDILNDYDGYDEDAEYSDEE